MTETCPTPPIVIEEPIDSDEIAEYLSEQEFIDNYEGTIVDVHSVRKLSADNVDLSCNCHKGEHPGEMKGVIRPDGNYFQTQEAAEQAFENGVWLVQLVTKCEWIRDGDWEWMQPV